MFMEKLDFKFIGEIFLIWLHIDRWCEIQLQIQEAGFASKEGIA